MEVRVKVLKVRTIKVTYPPRTRYKTLQLSQGCHHSSGEVKVEVTGRPIKCRPETERLKADKPISMMRWQMPMGLCPMLQRQRAS